MVTEKRYRSLLKTISWRVTATLTTILIAYLITGKTNLALQIGFVEFIIKIVIGYLHERIWLKLKFGLIFPPDYHI